MGWLSSILLAPLTGPVNMVLFVCEQVKERLDAEMLDESLVEDELVILSLRYDMGELAADEYAAQESVLLERINAIRAYKESLSQSTTDEEDGAARET